MIPRPAVTPPDRAGLNPASQNGNEFGCVQRRVQNWTAAVGHSGYPTPWRAGALLVGWEDRWPAAPASQSNRTNTDDGQERVARTDPAARRRRCR